MVRAPFHIHMHQRRFHISVRVAVYGLIETMDGFAWGYWLTKFGSRFAIER